MHTRTKTRLKKIFTISILFTLFFCQIGYPVVNMIQKHIIREEMEEQILSKVSDSELEAIDADLYQKDIVWEEEGKEFSLNGQMYDVARIKKTGNRTIIYCLNDKKEEELVDKYSKLLKSAADQDSSKKDGGHSLKFQMSDCVLTTLFSLSGDSQKTTLNYFVFNDKIISINKEIIIPPPRFDIINLKTSYL